MIDPWRDARRRAKEESWKVDRWWIFATGILGLIMLHETWLQKTLWALVPLLLIDIPLGIFIFRKVFGKVTQWFKVLKENEKSLALADKIVKDMSVLHDPEFRKEFEELDWEHQALVIREAKRKLKG